MSSGTTCHIGLQHSYTAAVCFCQDQSSTNAVNACNAYYSGGDIYIVAATSNSDTWGGMCIGNPN